MKLKNRHDSLILAAVILSALAVLAYYFIDKLAGQEDFLKNPDSYESCAARYPVMQIYPERCVTPDGRVFIKK